MVEREGLKKKRKSKEKKQINDSEAAYYASFVLSSVHVSSMDKNEQ